MKQLTFIGTTIIWCFLVWLCFMMIEQEANPIKWSSYTLKCFAFTGVLMGLILAYVITKLNNN